MNHGLIRFVCVEKIKDLTKHHEIIKLVSTCPNIRKIFKKYGVLLKLY